MGFPIPAMDAPKTARDEAGFQAGLKAYEALFGK